MGEISPAKPALLIIAAFSRHPRALAWAAARAAQTFGPIALASEPFPFVDTDYYTATMGPGLLKQFWAFERLIDPGEIAAIKIATNDWETAFAQAQSSDPSSTADNAEPDARPLNLDPGYLTLAKLVLASTKDHAHRIYLQQGIFAEVTLTYKHKRWNHHDYTFPDYRRPEYHAFFTRCRDWYKQAPRHK